MTTQVFINQRGTCNKSWAIEQRGTAVVTKFGRIGKWSQEQVKHFSSPMVAMRYISKKIDEKYMKGYTRVA